VVPPVLVVALDRPEIPFHASGSVGKIEMSMEGRALRYTQELDSADPLLV